MGRVRTKTVKRSARHIVEKYYQKLTLDFQLNKKIAEEVAIIPSKRLRNKIAGFVTHLMKRIQKGPVRNISLKLQEEERERRMDFVPEKSELDVEKIFVNDPAVKNMMKYVYDCQPLLAHLTVGGSTAHTVRTRVKPVAEGRQTCECECANPNPLTSMIPCTVRAIYIFLGISVSTDQTSLSTRESLTAADDTKSVRLWSKPGRGCSSFDDYCRQYLIDLLYCTN
jgi:small subunit ribosomal protein S17e